MAPRPRWYDHVGEATGLVPCEGRQHRLTWARGKLKLDDHDLGGERALMVLGGEPCACLQALRLWSDQFGMPPELFSQMQTWLGPKAVLAPVELALPRTLGVLLSWERSWKAQGYFTKQGGLIEREVKAMALPALRSHLDSVRKAFGCRTVRKVEVDVVPAGKALRVQGDMDRFSVSAEARLSTDWAVDVWGRGIAVVDDAFVVAVTGEAGRADDGGDATVDAGPTVTAIRWVTAPGGRTARPAEAPARLVRNPAGEWTIKWMDGAG